MSLETQIADLVKAGSDLVATFAGKKAAIDAAVNAALQAIPNNAKTVYVDSVAGDDAAAGTDAAPVKTLKKACDLVPIGGSGVIYLKSDATYTLDAFITISNKTLFFDAWGVGAKPVIAPAAFLYAGANACYGFHMFNAQLRFVRSKIKAPGLADAGAAVSTLNSVFARSDTGVVGDVTFSLCDIDLDKCHLFRATYATSMFRVGFYNSTVNRINPDGKLMVIDAGVATIGVSGLTLPAGTVLADLITGLVRDANSVPRNLMCNVVL